jgi:hypothetical protein
MHYLCKVRPFSAGGVPALLVSARPASEHGAGLVTLGETTVWLLSIFGVSVLGLALVLAGLAVGGDEAALDKPWSHTCAYGCVGLATASLLCTAVLTISMVTDAHTSALHALTLQLVSSIDLPLATLLAQSQLLATQARALWLDAAAPSNPHGMLPWMQPLFAAFGGGNTTAAVLPELASLAFGSSSGAYSAVRGGLEQGPTCILYRNTTGCLEAVNANGVGACNTTADWAERCHFDPRYSSPGVPQADWYETGRQAKTLDVTALHLLPGAS